MVVVFAGIPRGGFPMGLFIEGWVEETLNPVVVYESPLFFIR
jgi:hypothetical protein